MEYSFVLNIRNNTSSFLGLNTSVFVVELCCIRNSSGKLDISDETKKRGAELGRSLIAQYGIPAENILRHYDVTGKICPAPFVENPAAWEQFKGMLLTEGAEEYKAEIQRHVGFSEPEWVWKYLDIHPYAPDLYRKWAQSYR